MNSVIWIAVLLHALAAPVAAVASEAAMYSRVAPSADGTGKIYMGREISGVMSYHGASWLERTERMKEERPDLVLKALELKPAMVVADIGAGTGYYARRLAAIVGDRGLVYAVDIQPEMLQRLERALVQQRVNNIKPVLSTPTTLPLPPNSVDLAVMVDVYHELEYPYETLKEIMRVLKPGGRVAFVEFRANDPRVPIKALHTMTEEQIRREAAVHGLDWIRTVRELPWQHVVVFAKR